MIAERVEDLASCLARVASDPQMVRALHEILGSYCHQCRNTLNSLKLSLYLARRDAAPGLAEVWSELEPLYHRVERSFDRLQTICRPMNLVPIPATFEMLLEDRRATWTRLMAAHGRVVEFVGPADAVPGEFDPIRLAESLDAFVGWRAQAGEPGQPATLEWGAEPSRFEIRWVEASAWGFDPTEGDDDGPDALALPLLARVIAAHGGSFDLDLNDGLRLELAWPRRAGAEGTRHPVEAPRGKTGR